MGKHIGMLGAWIPDNWIPMFERGSIRAARALSIKRHKIYEKFLKAEKEDSMKKIIDLENSTIKTLIKDLRTLYLCMHRQFIIQERLGWAINRALNGLKNTRKQLSLVKYEKNSILQQILPLIDKNIADLAELRRQVIALLDKEIVMINRMITKGQIFTGLIKISEGGAASENISLSRNEARDVKRTTNLFERLHFIAASTLNAENAIRLVRPVTPPSAAENQLIEKALKTFKNGSDELTKTINEIKIVSKDELNMMNVLFYDQLTLIMYEDEDINKIANFFKKLGQEGFPPMVVADFLRKIDENVLKGERKRLLEQLRTEASYAESRTVH
ncbi:hypothetical protein HYU07_04000 [Candidatus Woesearchaeota archaeon]|nr:hypothetical protein [Candidatus Woesearchaeota archaeon]